MDEPIPTTAPRAISRRIDAETLTQIVNEYEAGATTAELRLKYCLSQGSLLKLLRANGATLRRQGLMPDQEKEAVRLYESGNSIGGIAAQLKASRTTVHNCLLRAKVDMRGTHDWHDTPPISGR